MKASQFTTTAMTYWCNLKTVCVILLLLPLISAVSRSKSSGKHKKKCDGLYDYIIVGGGTAGLVLANRLTEDSKVSVLVLEAGPSERSDPFVEVPRTTVATFKDSKINRNFKLEPQANMFDKVFSIQVGQMLGGGSSHNGMTIARASPYDFDKWVQHGNTGWSFKDVLKYYKKMETASPELANSDFRGSQGPFPIKYSHKFEMSDVFLKGGEEIGLTPTDYFSPTQGFGYNQQNIDSKGKRMSTAAAYFRPIMGRHNLKVITEAFVTKILIEGKGKKKRAVGVIYEHDGNTKTLYTCREVIVSAGSIQSPLLLMLSGIGPKQHLKSHGIKVKADLPIGEGLTDRFLIRIPFENIGTPMRSYTLTFEELFKFVFTGKGAWTSIGQLVLGLFRAKNQPADNNSTQLLISFRQNLGKLGADLVAKILQNNTVDPDLLGNFQQSSDGGNGLTIWIFHLCPRINGKLELKDTNPHSDPKITLNYLEDNKDVEDLIGGIRTAQKLMSAKALTDKGLNIVHNPVPECSSLLKDSDEYWHCFIKNRSVPGSQIMSTCRMADDGALDNRLKVKGFDNLRVVDHSIVPTCVSGNPMVQVIMIAERAADLIKEDGKKYKR